MKRERLIIIVIPMFITSVAFAQSSQVLDYVHTISGHKTIAGQHNKEPDSDPARWTDYIKRTTGKYPALWSGDFLFQQENIDQRWTMIHEAKRQWDHGSIINLMWHACPPDEGEPCKWDPGKFWWGGRQGKGGTAKLFQITHDYFTINKGLNNLIWVWDMQDMSRDFEAYNPGDEYWDLFGFDIYDRGYDPSWYKYILPIVGDKPMAIGECSKLPNSEILATQPRWDFFIPWAELLQESNSIEEIIKIYNDPSVITRDEMPGWE